MTDFETYNIYLDIASERDLPRFRKDLQEAFAIAAVEAFGPLRDGPIPSDADLLASFKGTGRGCASHSVEWTVGWRGGGFDQ